MKLNQRILWPVVFRRQRKRATAPELITWIVASEFFDNVKIDGAE